MGCTKYPIPDYDFTTPMLGSCHDSKEGGPVTLLSLTGMHISSLCGLKPSNLIKQGNKVYLQWVRPKTNKTLQAPIPKEAITPIYEFLSMGRKSRQYYHSLIKKIGERAGYKM